MKRALLATTALVMLLSACELAAEVKINPDGSGTIGFSFALDKTLFDGLPGGENPFAGAEDPFEEFKSQFAGGSLEWRTEEFTEGNLTGVRAELAFSSLEDLEAKIGQIDAEGVSDSGGFSAFAISRDGEAWVLNASGEGYTDPTAGVDDPFADEDPFAGGDPLGLGELFSVSYRVTLPGNAVGSNATTSSTGPDGTTFVWELDPSNSAPVAMSARTDGAATGDGPLAIIVGLLVIAILAIGVFMFLRMRNRVPAGSAVGLGETAPGIDDVLDPEGLNTSSEPSADGADASDD